MYTICHPLNLQTHHLQIVCKKNCYGHFKKIEYLYILVYQYLTTILILSSGLLLSTVNEYWDNYGLMNTVRSIIAKIC